MKHKYEEHTNCQDVNEGRNCNICLGGLSICAVCGLGEGPLTDDCPGVPVPYWAEKLSYAGFLNFRNGMWRNEPNSLGWADARRRGRIALAEKES